jgi:uncharacterized protein
MSAFVISKRLNGEYKFEFTSRKGKAIFTSNNFELRFECEETIDYIKRSLEHCTFMKFKSSSGKFYFTLILDKKEMAISRKYSTLLMMEKGINEILKYGGLSETLDFSNQDFVFPEVVFE